MPSASRSSATVTYDIGTPYFDWEVGDHPLATHQFAELGDI